MRTAQYFGPQMLGALLLAVLGTATVTASELQAPEFGRGDYQQLAQRIFLNEGAGQRRYLTHWNEGEDFPSLGIGHFIWFPAGVNAPFDESFPALYRFLQHRPGVAPAPAWLDELAPFDAPWPDRARFEALRDSPDMTALRDWLAVTSADQAAFVVASFIERWNGLTLPSQQQQALNHRLQTLTARPAGWFAVLDYFNFKGLGTNPRERYAGAGWGLLQVLSDLDARAAPGAGPDALLRGFSEAAAARLARRVRNAPPERNEQRWLPGWHQRVYDYSAHLASVAVRGE